LELPSVFASFSVLCLPPVFLVGLLSATVEPFFAGLSSFFDVLAVSFPSFYLKMK